MVELQAIDTVGRNVALNRTGNVGTDGVTSNSEAWTGYGSYYQVDFGARYDIKTVNMWRYWTDKRTYYNTVVVLSDNGTFAEGDRLVLFNADYTNRFGFGNGIDMKYPESTSGISLNVSDVHRANTYDARYIRIYAAGNNINDAGGAYMANHVVELQAMANGTNVALGKSGTVGTDGVVNTDSYTGFGGYFGTPNYYQVDFGAIYPVDSVCYWGYWKDARVENDLVVVLSRNGTFAEGDRFVLFNADDTNRFGFGCGADRDYQEKETGLALYVEYEAKTLPTFDARYLRIYAAGNDKNDAHGAYMANHVVELQAMANGQNVALGKSGTEGTDGVIDTNSYYGFGEYRGMPNYFQVDFGAVYPVDTVRYWGYWADARTDHNLVVVLSKNGTFSGDDLCVLWNADSTNRFGFGAGTDRALVETSAGKTFRVSESPASLTDSARARYVRVYNGGSDANDADGQAYCEHVTELQVFAGSSVNIAYGKTGTVGTDGIRNDSHYYGYGGYYGTPNYFEVDLGSVYDVTGVKLWQYYSDNRSYHNNVIVLSENGTFAGSDYTVIFNTDHCNMHGFGRGYDNLYPETSAGRLFPVRNVNAPSAGNKMLYAQWVANNYTINFDCNGAGVTGSTASINATYDVDADLTANGFSRTGYTFAGWAESADGAVAYEDGETVRNLTAAHNGSATLYAKWAPRSDTAYTVTHTIMDSNGSYDSVPTVSDVRLGTTEAEITAADAALDIAHYTLDATQSDTSISIAPDGSSVLNLYYKAESHTVLFKNAAGETVQTDTLYYGATPSYTGTEPVLAATGENTYTFLGWTANGVAEPGSNAAYYAAGNLPSVTADVTYYPYFGADVNSYDITFSVDGADTVVSLPYGATPAYNGIPAKAADEANTYAFTGWNPAIEAVSGDTTYTAQFNATPIGYLVRADAGTGSEITDVTGIYAYHDIVNFTVTVAEGYTGTPAVVVNGTPVETPAPTGNAYDYCVTVTGNTKITVADLNKQTFTITFDVDGMETEKTVVYGDTPTFGSVPAKAATAQYEYTFIGWAPAIAPATADATYIAAFDPVLRAYDISFVTPDGTTAFSVPYGETPVPGFTPAKAADAENTYEFAGWSTAVDGEVAALAAVDGAATYYAVFTATPIPATKYLITVNPGVGSEISLTAGNYTAGTELNFTVTVDEAYSSSEPIVTVGDAVITGTKDGSTFSYSVTVNDDIEISVSDLTKNTYTITYVVEGEETTQTVFYGEMPGFGSVPVKAADDENFYAFSGWTPAVVPATADATYTAVFTPTAIPAHEHSFDTFVRTVLPTCVSTGYDEYLCECGMTEQRNPTEINAANHAKDPILVGARKATETEDGYTGDVVCPACGETITEGSVTPKTYEPHVHSFDTFVSHADATCVARAFDIYACACGETEKRETGDLDPDNHAAALVTIGQRDATETEYGYTGDVVCPPATR